MNVLDLVISNIPDHVSDISLANPISTSDHDTLCFNIELPVMDGRNACNEYFKKYLCDCADYEAMKVRFSSINWDNVFMGCVSTNDN